LRSRSCIIDGESVAVGPDGIPSFDRLRYRRPDASVILFAFDLIELNGDDLRRTPIEERKAALTKLLSRAGPRIQLNEHIEEDGALSSNMHATSGLKASCRSARARPTARAALRIG
jgi:bifunctional non-homologous end joining protein LigD